MYSIQSKRPVQSKRRIQSKRSEPHDSWARLSLAACVVVAACTNVDNGTRRDAAIVDAAIVDAAIGESDGTTSVEPSTAVDSSTATHSSSGHATTTTHINLTSLDDASVSEAVSSVEPDADTSPTRDSSEQNVGSASSNDTLASVSSGASDVVTESGTNEEGNTITPSLSDASLDAGGDAYADADASDGSFQGDADASEIIFPADADASEITFPEDADASEIDPAAEPDACFEAGSIVVSDEAGACDNVSTVNTDTSQITTTDDVSTSEFPTEAGASEATEAGVGSGYYCAACSDYVSNQGCRRSAAVLPYDGGVPDWFGDRFDALHAFTCNEPAPSPCTMVGRWRVSFPNWQGCQWPLSYPRENGQRVPLTSFDFDFPTSEPDDEYEYEVEWEPGPEPCTMKGEMYGAWDNGGESGDFGFQIMLRANGDSACGTLHYIEGGMARSELVTAAVAERLQ